MNIPLHLLETLTVFASEKTVAATAQRLGTTQPTVTRQLQQLQEQVEHPLFETVGRQKKLTAYGELLAQKLRERFENVQNLIQDVSLEQGQLRRLEFRIGGRAEILKRVFGVKKFPVRVRLEPMGSDDLQKALRNGNVDIAILQENFSSLNYIKKTLFSDDWYLAVPEDFVDRAGSLEKWKTRAGEFSYAAYKKEMNAILSGLENIGMGTVQESFIFPDWITIEERVHRGLNWSVMPSSYVQSKRNYRTIKIPSLSAQTFYAYYKKTLGRREGLRQIVAQILSI